LRKVSFLVAMLVASLGIAGVAYAIDVNQNLNVKTTGKKGTKSKPRAIRLQVITSTSAKDETKNGTFASTKAVIHFDKNLKFNASKFPTCTEATVVKDQGKCPLASKVGSGRADAVVGENSAIQVAPTITVFNAKHNQLILRLKRGANDAADSSGVLIGTLKKDSGKYGYKLDVPIPKSLQSPVPGLYTTLKRFETNVSKTYKGNNYIESIGCTGGKYNFSGDFSFNDGTSVKNVATTSKC